MRAIVSLRGAFLCVLLGLSALSQSGCFSKPEPDCAFRCGTGDLCPGGYQCVAGYCRKSGDTMCDFPPIMSDGAVDVSVMLDAADPDAAAPIDAALPIDAAIPDATIGDAAPDGAPIDAPECTMSTTCNVANKPICASNVCAACTAAAQCTAKDANLKACLGNGECAACDDDLDCPANSPQCNLTTNVCGICNSDAACSGRATTTRCADNGTSIGQCIVPTPGNYAGCAAFVMQIAPTVTFNSSSYTEKCLQITAGDTVTFDGNFGAFPLRGAPGNPGQNVIPTTTAGMIQVPITFATPGLYGYYSDNPDGSQLAGAVLVVTP